MDEELELPQSIDAAEAGRLIDAYRRADKARVGLCLCCLDAGLDESVAVVTAGLTKQGRPVVRVLLLGSSELCPDEGEHRRSGAAVDSAARWRDRCRGGSAQRGESTNVSWFPQSDWVEVALSNHDAATTAPIDAMAQQLIIEQ